VVRPDDSGWSSNAALLSSFFSFFLFNFQLVTEMTVPAQPARHLFIFDPEMPLRDGGAEPVFMRQNASIIAMFRTLLSISIPRLRSSTLSSALVPNNFRLSARSIDTLLVPLDDVKAGNHVSSRWEKEV